MSSLLIFNVCIRDAASMNENLATALSVLEERKSVFPQLYAKSPFECAFSLIRR